MTGNPAFTNFLNKIILFWGQDSSLLSLILIPSLLAVKPYHVLVVSKTLVCGLIVVLSLKNI